jgi:hypothetical protein
VKEKALRTGARRKRRIGCKKTRASFRGRGGASIIGLFGAKSAGADQRWVSSN